MATTTIQHWRDRAIEKSVFITDAWEVTKSYAGRVAEWVLFLCMIVNIVEILPGVALAPLFSNIVLGTQVVMLDVGGFSLASMADHARRMGDEKAARRASVTGWFLIILMMVTLLLVAIGVLFPTTREFIGNLEKALILVRVVMTVAYGHVIHSLRSSGHAVAAKVEQDLAETFNHQLQVLTDGFAKREQQLLDKLAEMATHAGEKEQAFAAQLSAMQEVFQHQLATLQSQQIAQQANSEECNEAVNIDGNGEGNIVDISDYRIVSTDSQHDAQLIRQQHVPRPSTRTATASSTKGATPAKQKAQRILKKNPGMSAPELAKKAGISRQYASKILQELA